MTVATSVTNVIHDKNPRDVIWAAMKGWLDRIEPTGHDAVICVYERPEKTAGGIIVPETASRRSEDKFQGVVGLVVKVGPNFGSRREFLGLDNPIKVGDWVSFRTQDCVAFVLGDRAMRQVEGQFLRQRLADPDCII